MSSAYAPEPVRPCTKRPGGEHCPDHPYAKLTALGCVMCGGEQNAARDRKRQQRRRKSKPDPRDELE